MKYVISLILIGGAIAVFFLLTQEEIDKITILRAEETEIQQSLSELQELSRIRDQLLSQYNAINPLDLARLNHIVPSGIDSGLLIAEMEAFSQQNNLILRNISIEEEKSQTGKKGAIERTETKSVFQKIPVSFQVSGSYGAFRDFLTRLETNTRIMDIGTVRFNVTADETDFYDFSVEANVYWIGEI